MIMIMIIIIRDVISGFGTLDGVGGAMAWPSNNPKKHAHSKKPCGLQYVCDLSGKNLNDSRT